MTKREQQRHSSLPSTIIPLLIGAPQTMAEGRVRSLTSPADAEGGEETVELNPPHQHQSSGTLPSIRTSLMSEARSRTTSFTNSISESAEPEDIRDLDTRHYTAGPAVFYGPIAGPSSIPHGQTQRFPIRSDPSFHASSSRSTGYRTTYGYPSPSPQIPLPRLRPSRWDEGEAGTSSRVPGHQIQTRPRSPLELELNRRTLHVGEPRMGERREEYGGRFGPNPGSQTRSMRDNNQDAGGSNLRGLSAQPARLFSADLPNAVRMRNEEGPSLPAFEHLRVGVQDPQPYRWPATPGRIFSLEESIIPNRESEGDFPAFRLRPLKGEDEQRASSVQSEKRRRSTDDEDDGKRKTKVPRKILVACDFCRGRKLRCDGNKPCWNCTSRRICVYRPYLRRRGPGKAPKGSKSKKRTEGHLPSIDTFNPQIVVPERRRQDTIDTLPPYGDDGPPPYVGMGVRPQAGPGGGRDDDDDEETTDGRAEDGGSER